MSPIGLHPVSSSLLANRAVLAEGVKGIICTQVNTLESLILTEEQTKVIKQIRVTAHKAGLKLGSIEVYANGAINVYLRMSDDKIAGYATYRPLE